MLEALAEICPAARPDQEELRLAADLAARHDLTLCDAAYAAVAENRGAKLATLERALLEAGLGSRPSALAEELERAHTSRRSARDRRRPRLRDDGTGMAVRPRSAH